MLNVTDAQLNISKILEENCKNTNGLYPDKLLTSSEFMTLGGSSKGRALALAIYQVNLLAFFRERGVEIFNAGVRCSDVKSNSDLSTVYNLLLRDATYTISIILEV